MPVKSPKHCQLLPIPMEDGCWSALKTMENSRCTFGWRKIYDRSSCPTLLPAGSWLFHANISRWRTFCISRTNRWKWTQARFAKDENGKSLAYIRIKDENILATPVHLRVWQQSGSPAGELIRYTEREQLLLDLLEENTSLSLNRYCRQAGISRRAAEHLLAKFIRFDIVEPIFENHKFYFRLK